MPIFNAAAFIQPDSVAAAFAEINDGDGSVRLVGGGTDVILHSSDRPARLVDLGKLPLTFIETDADGSIRIGATATLTAILEHPELRSYAGGVLASMLTRVGSPLLRNMATIGGHLARGRLSDVVPVLLVLDAAIEYFDGGSQRTSLAEFFAAALHRRPLVITAVRLGTPPRGIGEFEKFERTAFDVAMLNVATYIEVEEGHVAEARVAVGETPALARLVPEAAAGLHGLRLDPAVIAGAARIGAATVTTAGDARASADYRTQLVEVGIRRCLDRTATRMGVA